MKKIALFIFLTFVFTFSILFLRSYFLWWWGREHIHYVEENYIEVVRDEKSFDEWYVDEGEVKEKEKIIAEKLKLKFQEQTKIDFLYFPSVFQESTLEYTHVLQSFFSSPFIESKIKKMSIGIHEQLFDVRGKMKNKVLHLFWVLEMKKSEFLAVGIHEFAHYVDLYFLKKSVLRDVSDYFYSLSWDSTKVMKSWSAQKDFVSGYAMTNKYEDFAESFTYYILHNSDFLQKTEKSETLKRKYDFFTKNLFKNSEFVWTDFSQNEKVQNYYRDITKIDFPLEKLLIFLEKWI